MSMLIREPARQLVGQSAIQLVGQSVGRSVTRPAN